jgi:hypothetical protein
MTKKIIFGVLALLLAAQFIRIDKTNPSVDQSKDFITLSKPNAEVELLLKESCYDCHSNTTAYPWYTNVAPVSWWLKNHINEGREHLNFSEWANYTAEQQAHKLEEMEDEIKEGEMPLSSYTITHSNANLSLKQREQLILFIDQLKLNAPHQSTH